MATHDSRYTLPALRENTLLVCVCMLATVQPEMPLVSNEGLVM